jgi:hypothetical protein
MKKNIWRYIVLSLSIAAFCFCLMGASCNDSTAEDAQTTKTNQELAQINKELGMPNITNFTEKKLMKEIYELRDQSNLVCYAYTTALDGHYVYIGECQGYGLPYSTEYTNPEKVTNGSGVSGTGTGNVTVPQADPNGLYMPSSANATWLVLIDQATGKPKIAYIEQDVTVVEAKLPANLCESWSLPSGY